VTLIDWLSGWHKHKSVYIDEAANKRGVEVECYIKGMLLKLKYKQREIVFHAVPCNIYGDPPDVKISYDQYIQEKVDEVTGIRWTFKYD